MPHSVFTPLLRWLRPALLALLTTSAAAQSVVPAPAAVTADHLPAAFHRERRELLRQALPPRSVAVLFAAPVRNRANDVDYVYHQNPDFYYLTGYEEPEAVLVLFKEPQTLGGQAGVTEALFVQPRDPKAERIEDDVLITDQGYENLSGEAPRTVAEIEALMARPSALDDFQLPELK